MAPRGGGLHPESDVAVQLLVVGKGIDGVAVKYSEPPAMV